MRGTRWLILAAIAAILGGVWLTWRIQQTTLRSQARPRTQNLPLDLNSSADDWTWTESVPGRPCPAVEVKARKFGQSNDNSRVELEHVQLKLYHKDCGQYDLIRSARAQFGTEDKRLFSDGDVEITLGFPVEGSPARKPITIRTSGVTFESATGRAVTDRPAEFEFENGKGKSVGASYDPTLKELHLNSQAQLDWLSPRPNAKPVHIDAGELIYKEAESKIWVRPWGRLTRENTVIDTGPGVISLQDGVIRLVDTQMARGADTWPDRRLQYAADELWVHLNEDGVVQKVEAQTNARLISTSASGQTTLAAYRVNMDFTQSGSESVLSKAVAVGNASVESKPTGGAENRVLRSDSIDVTMRAGGREIDNLETHAPGTLEFLPNRPAQRYRKLDAAQMWIGYGPQNRIQSFRATQVTTRTEPNAGQKKSRRVAAVTTSRNLKAEFDPGTGQMLRMEQWDDFTYQEGDRRARSARATLEQTTDLLLLEENARVWDASGATSADRIRLDQHNDIFAANGHVNSSRAPEKKPTPSGMLSGDQPLQAVAQSMTSRNRDRLVHYEGNVVMWQGANRIHAQQVDIDRAQRRLAAAGNVMTQFVEDGGAVTTVRAARLVYTETGRLARYTGGAVLARPKLQVKAAEIRAFLAEGGKQSRIDKAYADGQVHIVQSAAGRTRTGTGEHAEYYAGEEKIILRGGEPQLVDSRTGTTRGTQLTYWANDDRLLVTGGPGRPATSRIRRR